MVAPLVFALVCGALAPPPAVAKPLVQFAESDKSVRDANAELEELQRKVERGDIPKVQFDFGKATLRPESKDVLEAVADVMLGNARLKMMIYAHTDDVGAHDFNMKLSAARAKAVKEALVKLGVQPPAIRTRGMGPDDPIADNRTEEGRELNRRVEFQLMKRSWSSIW